jgi:hypothetical protein
MRCRNANRLAACRSSPQVRSARRIMHLCKSIRPHVTHHAACALRSCCHHPSRHQGAVGFWSALALAILICMTETMRCDTTPVLKRQHLRLCRLRHKLHHLALTCRTSGTVQQASIAPQQATALSITCNSPSVSARGRCTLGTAESYAKGHSTALQRRAVHASLHPDTLRLRAS